jgi:DNA-binding SARP family transcriptional activator/DNA-binding XRE family transcriptional regulator
VEIMANEASAASFGTTLRALRQSAGLSQSALAERSGLSLAAVRDLEQGRRSRPQARSLARLGRALMLESSQQSDLTEAAHALGAAAPVTGGGSPPPGPGVRIHLLGPLGAWRDGAPVPLGPPKQRAVLCLLALEPNALVHREVIIDVLWPDGPPKTAVNLVQTYVSRLRAALDPVRSPRDEGGLLVSAGTSYRLQARVSQLDLLDFRHLVAAAKATQAAGDLAAAGPLFDRALLSWTGEPVGDVDVLRGHHAVHRLARERVGAVLGYAEACRHLGYGERVVEELWTAVTVHPFHEAAHARLMVALAASGERATAFRVFEDIRQRLDREFGVQPGPDIAEAHALILRHDLPPG